MTTDRDPISGFDVIDGAAQTSLATALATESGAGLPDQIGKSIEAWNYYQFNPRGAATGSTLGTIGAAGATEKCIAAYAVVLGGIVFESDSVASNSLIVRDQAATGGSVTGISFGASNSDLDLKLAVGLCVVGTHINVCAVIKWRRDNG